MQLTSNRSLKTWGKNTGFNKNPKNILLVSKTVLGKARKFDNYSFTVLDRSVLPEYIISAYGNLHNNANNNIPLPMYSILNFDSILARYHALKVLQNFVLSHLEYEDSCNK